jgi:hypothetical protein
MSSLVGCDRTWELEMTTETEGLSTLSVADSSVSAPLIKAVKDALSELAIKTKK